MQADPRQFSPATPTPFPFHLCLSGYILAPNDQYYSSACPWHLTSTCVSRSEAEALYLTVLSSYWACMFDVIWMVRFGSMKCGCGVGGVRAATDENVHI